ncbi:uncharacterized protein PFLUO_LOCUS8399 [Penicillium psychrofluorescens]|uniref:uncharacterized protein n=1 Tax=Penicillium psychrofluorescens TaxID=3158075 RepID=UPI003CCD0E3E
MDIFWAAPPVTRTLTALALAQSALVHGRALSGYYVVFLPHLLWKLQLWRLVTPFLLTGGNISFLLDLYFLYLYGSSLETGSPRFTEPGAFFTYVVFVASVIMLTAGCFLGGFVFTSALILAFVYTYAQDNRGRKATFYVIQIPVEFLPWAMLLMAFVSGGPSAVLAEAMGIVAAHLYDFLTRIYPAFGGGRNWVTTPTFVRRYFDARTPASSSRAYGTTFRQAQPSSGSSSSGGWSSSLQNPWRGRGAGRRLGG